MPPKNNQPKPHTDREATKRTETPTASRVAYDLTTQKPHKVERTQAHVDLYTKRDRGFVCFFIPNANFTERRRKKIRMFALNL